LPLYDATLAPHVRFLAPAVLQTVEQPGEDEIRLTGSVSGATIVQNITLKSDHVHVRVEVTLDRPELEYILSPFVFKGPNPPEFVHSTNLKYAEDDIIGDRVFYAPALVLQHEGLFCALIPDLDLINDCRVIAPGARTVATGNAFAVPVDRNTLSMPVGIDLHLQSGWTEHALFSYGVIDSIATHHMHWRHPSDGSLAQRLQATDLCYGFDLFVSAEIPRFRGYQRASRHLWERYGSQHMRKPRPQAMPLEEYARQCYPASFAYQGSDVILIDGNRNAAHHAPAGFPNLDSWMEWEMSGLPVGGYRNNAPQWYDFTANTPFWNNARDAIGMYWWSQHLASDDLLDKARRMINFCLSAPQNQGLFPVIYQKTREHWQGNHWEPPMALDPNRTNQRYFDDSAQSYHTPSMSVTAAYMLRYYQLCEADGRILNYLRPYADFLIRHIDPNGCLPDWFSPDLQPNPHLRFNSEVGAHVWFLTDFYQLTGQRSYLDAALQMAAFLEREILPTQKWIDTECYFSCGSKPLDFYDYRQGQGPRGTLPMYFAADGFASLYRATGERRFLDLGEQVIDYMVFYQAVWQPHFIITAYAFGGWGTDNGDAAWLDARQGIVVDLLVWYGKTLGRQDLLERAVASARAGLVLVHHERHIANDIYAYPNFPFGLGPENIDHEGFSQSTMRTDASWGEVAGLDGAADALHTLGGIYVDFAQQIAVGVNGVYVRGFNQDGETVQIEVDNQLAALPHPYTDPYTTTLRLHGLPPGDYRVAVNGVTVGEVDVGEGDAEIPIEIEGERVRRG
jgi:hypothetical protein